MLLRRKTCKACNVEKALQAFYRHPTNKDGHFNVCKECRRAYTRANGALKKEQYAEKTRLRERSEAYKLMRKNWREANPQRAAEYRKSWAICHPERNEAAKRVNAARRSIRRSQRRLMARFAETRESDAYRFGNVPALLQLPQDGSPDCLPAVAPLDSHSQAGSLG